jgi:hypothetical protein
MTYLDRSYCKSAHCSAAYRSWHKTHKPGLHKWLIYLLVVFSTSSYARSAAQNDVAGSPTVSAAATIENVTVVMDIDRGPATYAATGFLHSFSATTPSDDLVVPIKPRLFRLNASTTWSCYPRVKRLGAKVQLVVSDSYGYSRWPGYNGYQSAWESTIAGLISKADSLGFTDIEWDLWNEPNYSAFWQASTQQFYDTWEIGYLKVRSLKPNAVIVGPSATGSVQYVKDFLLFAKAHDVLPDVLSFHVIWDDERNIPYYVDTLRSFMASNGINIPKISINEYISYDGSDSHMTSVPDPGSHARLVANLDLAALDSAAKSVWSSGATLDNVAPNNTKTSLWWVYKAYADITGRLVRVVSSPSIDGVAGHDLSTGTARVLLGSSGGVTGDVGVSIAALNQVSYLASGGKIHVVAERITASTKGSTLPQREIDADYLISNNQITVILPSFASTQAFVLTLSSPNPTSVTDPIATYAFDEGSGITASDSSGNGNTGTLLNGPVWTAGKVGSAVSFDGLNDSIMVANNSALMPSSSLTLAAWFNADAQQGQYATIIGKTASGGYWLGIDRDGLDCGVPNAVCGELFAGNGWTFVPSPAITYSTWNHVALTYDGSTARLYFNGVLSNTTSLSGTVGDATQPLCIGMDPNGGTCSDGPFKGLVDEVKIYNRALSASEIFTMANPGTGNNDVTMPVISAIQASNLTPSSSTISWTTNEASDSQVEYGTTTSYGKVTTLNSTAVTAHTASLSGLSAQTTYDYHVKSKDAAGNLAVSSNYTFTTPPLPNATPDIVPPQVAITSPLNGAKVSENHNFSIKARATDNVLVSRVEFYVNGVLKGTGTVPGRYNIFKYVWKVPPPAGVTYSLKAIAYDASNNVSSSGVISVTSK